MLDAWFANNGATLRALLIAHTPDLLHGLIASAPMAVLLVLATIVLLAAAWAVVELLKSAFKMLGLIGKATKNPADAFKEIVSPPEAATQESVEKLDAKLERVLAILDKEGAEKAATGSAPLGTEELTRRNTAAAEIVSETTPAAEAAVREIVAGDIDAAIATLKRDARADVAAAAEKWRRLGALVRGVDTAEARAAYEEAFKLQPDDFSTCVELARLRREAGDLNGARIAAEAAERAASAPRDHSVAADTLGNVLREAGDLAAAQDRKSVV